MIKEAIVDIVAGRQLTATEAEAVMDAIMDGQATDAQIAAFLVAIHSRGETVEELTGMARSMRTHVKPLPVTRQGLIDTCGTGGGGASSINVSTAAAVVAAAAGVGVAKHGNRAATSRCGSADVLDALGIDLEQPAETVAAGIDAIGIGFLFAPAFHPAMKHAIGPRREIGVRTTFNLLGPLTNPAGVRRQVLGVPEARLTGLVAETLAGLGAERALVVHGLAGLDELSPCGPTRVCEVRDGWVRSYQVTPEEAGLASWPLSAVAGGDAAANAAAITAVLAGDRGAHRDFVVLNAAAALIVGGAADDWPSAARLAEVALDGGRAQATLEAWRSWPAG